ncbi:MAG: hypothetical protein O3B84_04360, partial [Chloroflexi bacterium]|nr:hypothetical protein [Chloroflexota bacterium]
MRLILLKPSIEVESLLVFLRFLVGFCRSHQSGGFSRFSLLKRTQRCFNILFRLRMGRLSRLRWRALW